MPGQMLQRHCRAFHGSQPSRSSDRRIGSNAQYILRRVRQTAGRWDRAKLVRGRGRYGHFVPEPRPEGDYDPASLAFREEMTRRRKEFIHAGATP